jgi:hypothetical protein
MPTVIANNIDGLQITQTLDGLQAVRPAIVDGITTGSGIEKAVAAFAALDADGYTMKSRLVTPMGELRLTQKTVTAISSTQVNVSLAYTSDETTRGQSPDNPTLPTYRVSARLVQDLVNVDVDGNPITVEYKGDTQRVSVPVLVPQATITASRVETGINPGNIVDALLGKVSRNAWNGPAGRWLSISIEAESTDGMETWRMDYQFQRDMNLWKQRARYTLDSGKVPIDLTDDGDKVIDLYEDYPFESLGL